MKHAAATFVSDFHMHEICFECLGNSKSDCQSFWARRFWNTPLSEKRFSSRQTYTSCNKSFAVDYIAHYLQSMQIATGTWFPSTFRATDELISLKRKKKNGDTTRDCYNSRTHIVCPHLRRHSNGYFAGCAQEAAHSMHLPHQQLSSCEGRKLS